MQFPQSTMMQGVQVYVALKLNHPSTADKVL